MQITKDPKGQCRSHEYNERIKNLTSKWNKNNNTLSHMLCIWFVAEAFRCEEFRCLKKGTHLTYFCPALDPSLGGSGRKTTTLVRDHEYFIPTKFHQNP